MSRRGVVKRKPTILDDRYHDAVIAKFITTMMNQGKKLKSTRIVYNALERIQKTVKEEKALTVFHQALNNVKPTVEVRSRRVGGATYQVPVEVSEFRRQALAIRWIIDSARKRNGKSMIEKLVYEIVDAWKKTGTAFKKKEETHRMAEANKVFAHYRW